MLPDTFKDDIRELIALAKECPENLQEKCLQILLDDYLRKPSSGGKNKLDKHPTPEVIAPAKEAERIPETPDEEEEEAPEGQRDLLLTDLHLKARKFCSQYQINLDDINQLFFIEDGEIKPLYDDLKTTKASETQIRIGLLQALRSGIKDGEFQFNGESVREECQERKSYDGNNFTVNFKNSANLFAGFEKYDKLFPVLKLTDAGKQRLAETIRELK